jgi:hypothetical protein
MRNEENKQGLQDDIHVDPKDKSEVEYLHRQFPELTYEQIAAAVKAKGPLRREIVEFLVDLKRSLA